MSTISQLGAQDSQFLYVQGGDVLTHVMTLSCYDPASASGGIVRYNDIVRHVAARCHVSPVFRRKLYRLPFDLDHPYWVEDRDFDVEAHISRVRLRKPGDWQQFCNLAARHFARPMDMTRPLWDMCFVAGIDGLPNVAPGSFALLQRFHHAAIDGASGAHALLALSDTDSRGTPAVPAEAVAAGLGDAPSAVTMLTRALASNLTFPVKMANALLQLAPALASAATRRLSQPARSARQGVPVTRFNQRVSSRRTFDAVTVSLSELARLRRLVDGATVNDVVLAVCSGALRRYLQSYDELPRQTLVAVVPINARRRQGAAAAPGNDISAMTVELGTNIAQPVPRLQAIRDYSRDAKESKAGLGARVVADLTRHIPGATLTGVARLLTDERITRNQANLIITNVPGVQTQLYMTGARLTHQFGMGPVTHGLGLFIAAISYDRSISLCVTADRHLVPDVDQFCRCIEASLRELRLARRPA